MAAIRRPLTQFQLRDRPQESFKREMLRFKKFAISTEESPSEIFVLRFLTFWAQNERRSAPQIDVRWLMVFEPKMEQNRNANPELPAQAGILKVRARVQDALR
jgi:hypothetical protein